MKKFIQKNIKLLIIISIIILISAVGATLALTIRFDSANINAETKGVLVNIRYEKDENNEDITSIKSIGNMLPTTIDIDNISEIINSDKIIKFKFWVSGDISNPSNSIYDIALNNINIDCELKNTYFKWLLYKNNTLLYSGNFSPTFDEMPNNRMILTSTQEDLTKEEDEYLFAIYIEESCLDFPNCSNIIDQSSMLGKSFNANINIETSTKTKKNNIRTTGEKVDCTGNNIRVAKPMCAKNLIYNGTTLSLLDSAVSSGVTVNQSSAISAGEYTITAKLSSGYKWEDDTIEDYSFNCKVNKRSITISTQNQTKKTFISSPEKVNVTNLVIGHTINKIKLSTISASKGDIVVAGSAIIHDEIGNDVTNNYIINYQSIGKIIEE